VNGRKADGIPVLMPASAGRIDRVLLSAKADLTAAAFDGATALTAAAFGGHAEVVEISLDHQVDPNSKISI
jgi:hypothetical protein